MALVYNIFVIFSCSERKLFSNFQSELKDLIKHIGPCQERTITRAFIWALRRESSKVLSLRLGMVQFFFFFFLYAWYS